VSSKVLVADDEAHIRHVVSMKLRRAGFEVITAQDGEEAVELCREELPDLIITDYQMPFMTGVEFCTAIRNVENCKSIPAVMLTARGFDVDALEMAQAGITRVLEKPFSPREILAVTKELLRGEATSRRVG